MTVTQLRQKRRLAGPMFQKRHYEAIAQVLKRADNPYHPAAHARWVIIQTGLATDVPSRQSQP